MLSLSKQGKAIIKTKIIVELLILAEVIGYGFGSGLYQENFRV